MTAVDITQRKHAEDNARREERRARDYLNIAGSAIVALDAKANLILVNSAGCRLFKCKEADVTGKNAIDLFLAEHEQQPAKDRYARWMQGELQTGETFLRPLQDGGR